MTTYEKLWLLLFVSVATANYQSEAIRWAFLTVVGCAFFAAGRSYNK